MKRIFLIGIIYTCLASFSQDIKVKGQFLQDSMQLGQRVSFLLTVAFPYELQVLMPDSTADFGPFELVSMKTSSSVLSGNTQIDSVVYELVSFKLDSIQSLRLPIYSFENADSSVLYSNRDSVVLKIHKVENHLVSNTNPIAIKQKFNYQIWFLGLVFALVFGYLLYRMYYNSIKRMWQKTMQRRKFKLYIRIHNQLLKEFQHEHNVDVLERIVGNWKTIMSDISGRPISTYTAKEINQIYQDPKLYTALQEIDKAIYSKKFTDALYVDIEIIYNTSKLEFFKQLKSKK